jgi:hypothetical protein
MAVTRMTKSVTQVEACGGKLAGGPRTNEAGSQGGASAAAEGGISTAPAMANALREVLP